MFSKELTAIWDPFVSWALGVAMRWLVSLPLLVLAFTESRAARAQDVLDRVEPTRLEDRTEDQAANEVDLTADFEDTNVDLAPGDKAVFVGAIEIVGLTALRNSEFADIVQGYIGRSLVSAEIAALTDALAGRARKRFPLATAWVEPQDVRAGILRVQLDEGRVDAIELAGFRNERLEKLLGRLVTGRPATAGELEGALLLAGDVKGISIGKTSVRRKDTRNTLVVEGSYSRFRGQQSVDNDTIEPIGPLETFGSFQANGLLSHDDSLQAYFLAALPEPEELGFVRLRYAKRIGNADTEMSLAGSYSRSVPGSYLAPLAIVSESWWAALGISQPLMRSVRRSLWLEGSFSWREVDQRRANTASRLDRLSVARLRLLGSTALAGGVLHASGALSQGLDMLDATPGGSTMASRPDADGTFTSLLLAASWSGQIAGALGARAAVRSQLASGPLLLSEEIGLGGASFARGYDYSERSGDRGTMGYLEVNYDFKRVGPVQGLKPYAFLDGGRVTNLRGGLGGGSLFSAGGGIRLDVDRRTDAAIEVATPLSGNRFETGDESFRFRGSLTRYF